MKDCGKFRGFGGGVTRGGYKGTLLASMGQILLTNVECMAVSFENCSLHYIAKIAHGISPGQVSAAY